MLTRLEALQIALAQAPAGLTVRGRDAIELSNGWYFPWRTLDDREHFGSHGLIVNKESGETLQLGSAFQAERDCRAYEAGMTNDASDIRIDRIANLEATLDFLGTLRPMVVVPEFDGETTWRIPRELKRDELRARLSTLPHTIENVAVYFAFEAIEAARAAGCCAFALLDPRHHAEP